MNKLSGLFSEFAKILPTLDYDCPEREARIRWANEQLPKRAAKLESWNQLSAGEVRRLTRLAREHSGSGPGYRSLMIAKLAHDFWGVEWDNALRQEMQRRFRTPRPQSLSPGEAHAMIEELLSRISRRDRVSIENVRRRFTSRPTAAVVAQES